MDVRLTDGRLVRVHDTGSPAPLTILWHHGSPQTGALLDPLVAAAGARGIRLLSYARPAYRGSTPSPGRDVASAAGDVGQILDALGLAKVAVMGASGGGPHALACAALLPGRVTAAVCLASPAPYTDEFDWYAGMASSAALRAAAEGREARARLAAVEEFDEAVFTAADWAALDGGWSALGADAARAGGDGPDGLIDDDVAFAAPWGLDVSAIDVPVLLAHGGADRMVPLAHSQWLLSRLPAAELWTRPRDGHITILNTAPVAMDWLRAHA